MDIIYFIYGLSFVVMAVAIFVTRSRSSDFAFANNVLLLGAFGALHGLLEWTYLWSILHVDPAWLTLSRPWLMLASFVPLLEFGRRTLLDSGIGTDAALHKALAPGALYAAMALCIAVSLQLGSLADFDIFVRYFVCIPACLFSGMGVRAYFRARVPGLRAQIGVSEYGRCSNALSAALIAYGVFAGLVVPASDWFPASVVNQSQFNAWFGMPVQILRTSCAVMIALSAVCLLKLFKVEAELNLRAAVDEAKAGQKAIQAENALLLRNQALQSEADLAGSRNLAKSEFLANMSHEIRTPLSAIAGMAALIGREALSTSQADKLRKLEVAVKHLSATINDILDLSKIEANKLVLEQGPVQIDELLNAIAGMVQHKLDEKGLQFDLLVEDMPKHVLGDSTRLGQALLNYLGNAVKFTDQGRIGLHACVIEDSPDSAMVRMEVRDTGPGIAPEIIARLFEPFVQADNTITREYGGTGLGLAITRKLVEAMGGEVGVHSEVGKGITFWFTARLMKDLAPQASAPTAPAQDAATTLRNDYAGRRVLLAEDDEFNREIGCILLQEVGLVVEVAQDGAEAVEMAASRPYDLILMDVQMPKLDGLNATRQIRASSKGRALPIVAMTANAFHEDKMRCMQAGMDEFLAKPVDAVRLYQVIVRLLQENSLPV